MFIRASYDRENKTVHYFDKDGYETLYIGGSFAWRTNNPGNLTKPGNYVMPDAIGYAQRTSKSQSLFVIFSDVAAGHRAHQNVVKRIYGNSTIAGMITKYAPPSENDTQGYIDKVTSAAKVSPSDVINTLSDEKLDAVSAAMEKHEGYVPGVIKQLGKSTQVTLLDCAHNPLPKQNLHIKTADRTIIAQTNTFGILPMLHARLVTGDISLYMAREKDELEHIGDIIVDDIKSLYTFVAPYLRVSARPQIHRTDIRTRPDVHIVRPGETLGGIASRYGTTVDALVSENHLPSANVIYARQHLKIPAHAPSLVNSHKHASVTHDQANRESTPSSSKTGNSPNRDTAAKPPPEHSGTTANHASHGVHGALADGVSHQRNHNGHPETVVSSEAKELSGKQWCDRFPGSRSIESLNTKFRRNASAFKAALEAAGIVVRINAALRPNERSYLMHSAFNIAKGAIAPDKVTPYPNVSIDWVHRKESGDVDIQASRNAAREMCAGFQINPSSSKQKVARPGTSRHNFGAAVDLNIANYSGKKVKDASGDEVEVKTFKDLTAIGASYGVIYYSGENMHWSDTGH